MRPSSIRKATTMESPNPSTTTTDNVSSTAALQKMLKAAAHEDDSMEDNISLAETESVGSLDDCPATGDDHEDMTATSSISACDACPHCDDKCNNENCQLCQSKETTTCIPCRGTTTRKPGQFYTMCQVRRHNNEKSAWIVAGDDIYDATPILKTHPAGSECILRKAGGVRDCTDDFYFHSKRGQKLFQKYLVGKVRSCNCNGSKDVEQKQWWVFW